MDAAAATTASPGALTRDEVTTDPAGAGNLTSAEALAAATSLFADTFHRWSSRMAVEAGANLTRLRLLHLVRCHGPLKMADLAGSLAVTPRSVTALVDGLEAEELVRRIPHSTDRRVTLVELTCNRDLVQARMSAYQSSLESLFADMPEDDRVTLRRLLVNLRDRMDAGAAPRPRSQDGRDA
jgi:DNA-binding MarR family transcriptional regulator